MLINLSNIKPTAPKPIPGKKRHKNIKLPPNSIQEDENISSTFVSDRDIQLTKAIGTIEMGKSVHYYSFGNFNLVRLIVYLLKQLGSAHVFMSSYSFSTKSINQLHNLIEKKQILSFRVLLDNRVRSISPKPFQLISTMFNYRCTSIHAKTAIIYNDKWQISIVTSQNATDNPKMERGIIFTDPLVFQFDLKNLTDAFNRGTT